MFPKNERHGYRWVAILAAALLLTTGTIHASQTDPTLFLSRAVSFAGNHGRLVRIDGLFPWNALLQSGYPVQVVIWNAENDSDFVRFDLAGNAVAGTTSSVEGGLTPAEATSLAAVGTPDPAQTLSHVGPGRIDARLTGALADVPLSVQIFVIDGGTTFVSNPIPVSAVTP
ncbi:MAG TPA: hypothetical protein ENI85_11820 [Deltaproteobacteria bacterium]|nr:hypothetical protein [Deltaproteobacteria bacterium]